MASNSNYGIFSLTIVPNIPLYPPSKGEFNGLYPPSKGEFNGRIPPLKGAGGCYSSSSTSMVLKQSDADWTEVFNELKARGSTFDPY